TPARGRRLLRRGESAPAARCPSGLEPTDSGGLDLHDLELAGSAWRAALDDLAFLLAHDRLADGRLVRELVLGGVRLGGADDPVLERLVRVDVAELHPRADPDGL